MRTYIDKFIDIGMKLIEGLAYGIGKLAGSPLKLIKSIGSGLVDGFKSMLGIHSPSRVFKQFGEYMMEGLKEGLDDGSDKAVGGIEDVADNMNNAISKVSDYISENMDDEDLTIKPVLDLSDVDKGVKDIQSLMSGISGGTDVSVTGDIAAKTSRSIERKNSESVAGSGNQNVVTNEGDNYYSTFNITTNDPEEFAKEADTILQKLRLRANLAKGGAR